ncbi:MAG TPA: 16S rRNA (guanine(527)-N(7))-methyltransferase RsmG [Tepidisphaeraceae bacterium]|jgi:16S rRNA (guanine527-N7)-methyltransferase|nr:16S rRNA (guanine(527)-N(7))-methyltransferase RsmG [Tepidisphaeraceae bacterium]
MNELWNTLAARANVVLDASQHERLSRYLDLLFEANATMNLTRITDRAAAEVQHIGDSLTLLPYLPAGPIVVADVGSGGGVPGIPLAIARPDAQVLLIESTKKKAVFLERAATALALTNVRVTGERAEDIGQSGRRQTFDVAVARAVATLDWLAEWCLPLVKSGGKVLAMKGKRAAEELPLATKAIRMLGGGEPLTHAVQLPGAENYVIIEIPKVGKSDKRYPRPATEAKGKPIH